MQKRTNYILPHKKNITKNLTFFLVGGFIRDKIMQIINLEKDWVVVNSTFKEMFKLNFKLVGKDFPVFLHPINKEEFALARKEKKVQKGHKGFKCYFSKNIILQNDVYRRDLSMNAITMNANGKIIDIFSFKKYIKNKVIKHISNAFSEDPLRILRVARFWCKYYKKGFLISGYTYFLIKKLIQTNELNYVANERIVKETNKANKYSNIKPFLFFLYMSKALKFTSEVLYLEINNTIKFSISIKLNTIQQLNNVQHYINQYSNNNVIKQINIMGLDTKVNKYTFNFLQNFYKEKLIMSKKNIKSIYTLILIELISNNILIRNELIINTILQKIKINKDIIKIINILLISEFKETTNKTVNTFYKKYIILDILDHKCKLKNQDSFQTETKNIQYVNIAKIINFYKNFYFKF